MNDIAGVFESVSEDVLDDYTRDLTLMRLNVGMRLTFVTEMRLLSERPMLVLILFMIQIFITHSSYLA
jgi:hypothetical protein